MNYFITTLTLLFLIDFGAEAQYNYHYSGTTEPTWGNDKREITISIDVTTDSLYKDISDEYTAHYGIYFSYTISFFENGKSLPNDFNYNFYDLRLKFNCGEDITDYGLIDNYKNQGNKGIGILANNNQYLDNPHEATLESLSCTQVEFHVKGPGISEKTIVNPSSSLP